MVDFIDEVRDELKRDRFESLLRKYGKYLAAIVIISIGIATAVSVYKGHIIAQQEQAGDKFREITTAISNNDDKASELIDKLITENPEGYRELAMLRKAGLHVKNNEQDTALAIYDRIAADSKTDRTIRDLAGIRAAMLLVEKGDAGADARLEALAAKNSPFRYTAMELQAVRALESSDNAKASELYTSLTDDAMTPPSLKSRAGMMIKIIKTE